MNYHGIGCKCPQCKPEWDQLIRLENYLEEHEWTTESVKAFCRLENVPEDSFTVACCNMPEEA